jgi:RNA polymerase sigma factor (sigma-70 family)
MVVLPVVTTNPPVTVGVSPREAAPMTQMREVPFSVLPADFERLYRNDFRRVVALVQSVTGRRDVAEELTQEAFVVAHDRWAAISGYARPGDFVRRVALNRAVSAWRRRQAEERAVNRLRARTIPNEGPARGDHADAADPLWEHVRRLPKRQAQVVALTYVDDLTPAEVAEVLGTSENTVRTHLHRAKVALARTMSELAEGRSGEVDLRDPRPAKVGVSLKRRRLPEGGG